VDLLDPPSAVEGVAAAASNVRLPHPTGRAVKTASC
jgi:hypothetical protein